MEDLVDVLVVEAKTIERGLCALSVVRLVTWGIIALKNMDIL